MDREIRFESDFARMLAHDAGADTVQRSDPWQGRWCINASANEPVQRATRATLELGGCTAAERQQQQPIRIGTVRDEVCDTMRERIGLARSRAGNDQQRSGFAFVRAVGGSVFL